MTEAEARAWFVERFGEARTARVGAFLDMVCFETEQQNLISPASVASIWIRHGLDSAQLMFHVEQSGGWLDIGTGGGFPGMIVAICGDQPTTMVEPRRKRAAFLEEAASRLGLTNTRVVAAKVESVTGTFATISARAVASVEKLLQAAEHCATPETRWILPRGRIEAEELARLRRDRTRVFHVEHSLTDPQSTILLVDHKQGRAR
ncbi:16S rRNA (guanine(527)-N(7))-methyltransferase RsmG [Sphingomonas sp. RIT328]|uniref:16S rRNA (guanine(527)-N(7))-methyltransferase RsmG n=1 Tax=Sphingomonas sp. RIT328 TaxID=1470591 RepID=UPI000448153C|nr:16S rRNA (guanine(527)-N(7))-methyltransferase RsmG [Sphingomonas sp. RIT328]EZP49209.1 Ribosomal RNA small subunit methyltransferase G [Sphingomonas sp. RIT328]